MKRTYLNPQGKTTRHFLEAVARARGCATASEIEEFLAPAPPVRNYLPLLPDYAKAAARLRAAIAGHERVLLFGDWDCDGILALTQMRDLVAATGFEEVEWFIPDRRADDYGLTPESVRRCYEQFQPRLIISVDCGSPSREAVAWLKERGVDVIIIDHHQLGAHGAENPALAHLNPKAHAGDTPELAELREMSAAGLAYLFCEQFAKENDLTAWDAKRSLILAGLGTVSDVMRLTGVNRALAKGALSLARVPAELARVPGLVALNEEARAGEINASTFGFVWGPRLNATGRLEEATAAVKLLMAQTVEEARPFARHCQEANDERRRIQAEIAQAAHEQAAELMRSSAAEEARVLVLYDQTWHPGVVGIVASKIKERYSRPAIVLGWHEDGFWKGSGRSIPAYDLGGAIQRATQAGLLLGGGGHRMAAGLKAGLEQIDDLRAWLNSECALTAEDFAPELEILGRCESLAPAEWCEVFEALEPCGNGNPRPLLWLSHAELCWGPSEMRGRDNTVWALKAGFKCAGGATLYCVWSDLQRARAEWVRGTRYDAAVSLSRTVKEGRVYFNWRVAACERAASAQQRRVVANASKEPEAGNRGAGVVEV